MVYGEARVRIEDRIASVDNTATAAVRLHQGTIVSYNGLMPVVYVSGAEVEMVDTGTHVIGDIVQVLSSGGRWVVLGTVTPGSAPTLAPSFEYEDGWNWDVQAAEPIVAGLRNNAAGGAAGLAATPANTGGASGDAFQFVGTSTLLANTTRFAAATDLVAYGQVPAWAGGMIYVRTPSPPLLAWDVPETGECYLRFYTTGYFMNGPFQANLVWSDPGAAEGAFEMKVGIRISRTQEIDDGGDIANNFHEWTVSNAITPSTTFLRVLTGHETDPPWMRVEAHIVMGAAGSVELRYFEDPDSDVPTAVGTYSGDVGQVAPYLGNGPAGATSRPVTVPAYKFNRIIFRAPRPDLHYLVLAGLGYSTEGWMGPVEPNSGPSTIAYDTLTPFVGTTVLVMSGTLPIHDQVYSDAIDVDPGQTITVSVATHGNSVVVDGAKLHLWYGETEEESLPGGYSHQVETLAVEDLANGVVTLTNTTTVPADMEYVRVVIEIDTVTTGVANPSVQIADVSIK